MPLFLGSWIQSSGYKGLLEKILKTSPRKSRRKRRNESVAVEVQTLEPRQLLTAPVSQVIMGLPGVGESWDYSQGYYSASPIAADVNSDGKDDIIVVTGDKQVIAYEYSNPGDLATLNVIRTYSQTGTATEIYSTPAVANVPGIGKVIFAGAADGRVFAWNAATGELLPGWPQTVDIPVEGGADLDTPQTIFGGISVADLDGDGVQEVLVTSVNHRLTVFRMDGSLYWQFNNDAPIYTSPVVADINRDGKMDVLIAGDSDASQMYDGRGRVTLLSGDGRRIWVFQADQAFRSSPTLFDLDLDGKLEIVAIASGNNVSGDTAPNMMYILDSNGIAIKTVELSEVTQDGPFPSAAIGDFGGGLAEQTVAVVVDPQNLNRVGYDQSTAGNPDRQFLTNLSQNLVSSPIVADVNGDYILDVIIATSNIVRAYSGVDNSVLWDIVRSPDSDINFATPLIGHFNGDSTWQLVFVSHAIIDFTITGPGAIQVYDLTDMAGKSVVDWPMFRRDATGATPLNRTSDIAGAGAFGLFQLIMERGIAKGPEVAVEINALQFAPSISSYIDRLFGTAEYRDNRIKEYYQTYLGRTPDAGGLEFWREFIDSGNNLLTAQIFFVASDEAFNNAGSAQAWVSYLYETVLDRTPSQGEIDGWANRLISGELKRSDIASGFLYSLENSNRVIGQLFAKLQEGGLSAPTADVFYAASWDLHRGKNYQEIVRDILETTAGVSRHGGFVSFEHSDYLRVHAEGIFIRSLYDQLLNRAPSAGEVVSWMQSMEAGMTFEQVAAGFVRSTEYRVQVINQYFGIYLGRSADQSELEFWLGELEGGASREAIPVWLMELSEYYFSGGYDIESFVERAFQNTLGRSPTPEERQQWENDDSPDISLPRFLTSSEEFFRRLIDKGALQFARRLPNTPADGSAFFNPSAPYGAQAQLDFLLAGGNSEILQIEALASAEYRQLLLTGAFWTGKQWNFGPPPDET